MPHRPNVEQYIVIMNNARLALHRKHRRIHVCVALEAVEMQKARSQSLSEGETDEGENMQRFGRIRVSDKIPITPPMKLAHIFTAYRDRLKSFS